MVLLSTTHILKSQSQVGIKAGRSCSGFCLIWSVTAVRGWSPLVTAVVRGCLSSVNLVSELPNTVKQLLNTVRHCLRPPPPSAAVRRRPTTQFRPETTGSEPPLRATANPAGVAGSAVATRLHVRLLCSLQPGACRPRAAFPRRLPVTCSSSRHLRRRRRSLLYPFWPSNLCSGEVQ